MVFRGFSPLSSPSSPALTWTTDARSEKCRDVAGNGNAEIVWWFPGTKEQYRFSGSVDVITSAEEDEERVAERARMWGKMREEAQVTFGQDRPGAAWVEGTVTKPLDPDGVVSENFVVMSLDARSVDYLCLEDSVRRTYERKETGEWESRRVNP